MASNIEVFRTSISTAHAAAAIGQTLTTRWPNLRITFDLDDCDRVLRIESFNCPVDTDWVQQVVQQHGYACEPLPE